MERDSRTEPLAPDLSVSSVFRIRDLDHVDALYAGSESGFIYARDGHPNASALAQSLAELEGGEEGLVLSSGMGATAAVLLDLLQPDDRVVAAEELYGKTLSLMRDRLGRLGINTTFVNANDLASVEAALANRPKLLWVETISNPLLRVAGIDRLAELAHAAGALLAVDATFAPPPILSALSLGADLVVHSLTKILSGHADVTLGCVVGSKERIASLRMTASTFGYHAAAMDCWLTQRGLATLELRVTRSCENALRLAEFLQRQTAVAKVHYPGLSHHPDHEWMRNHSQHFGYMVSFELPGGRDAVNRLFQRLERIPFCPSLGDIHTTVSHPATTSHRGLTPEARAALGIRDGLVRVSVGIEPIDQIIGDFEKALSSGQ